MSNNGIICIETKNRLRKNVFVETAPYPAFPTDLQAPLVTFLSVTEGIHTVKESVFESRFAYADELKRMGADVTVNGSALTIRGVKRLRGNFVRADDLRGGAALVMAGLAAEGETVVSGIRHIDRGYEAIEKMYRQIGARIERG